MVFCVNMCISLILWVGHGFITKSDSSFGFLIYHIIIIITVVISTLYGKKHSLADQGINII